MQELFTRKEAAAKLRIGIRTLDKHVAAGVLRYISIGHGRRHIRRMFAPSDLEEFIANQRQKDSPLCLSENRRTHRSTTTSSSSEVIGFTARLAREAAAKRKPLSGPKGTG
jgi:hypothetical protein